MHSRIFQIDTKSINTEDYESYDYVSTLATIADYVAEDEDREDSIEWMIDYLKGKDCITHNKNENSFIFKEGCKEKFFEEKYSRFKLEISNLDLEIFCDSLYINMLQRLINNRYGFYFLYKDSLYSLDEFIRECIQYDKKYYIGGTYDYHA